MCAIESTGHHEEACSLQPIGFWMKWKCFHEIMTGMGNPFLATDNKLHFIHVEHVLAMFFSQIYKVDQALHEI